MTEFGTYVLKYKAPKGSGESKVKMTIGAEATVTEMLAFFADFLRGSGYVFDGDIVIDNPREPLTCENHWNNFWEDDGNSVVGNPWNVRYDTPTYIGLSVHGGMGEDHLSFSYVTTPFSSNPTFS